MYEKQVSIDQWTFTVIVEPDEEGGFVAHCPELKGCWSQGETLEETLHNVADAISGWLSARIEYAIDASSVQAFREKEPSWPLTITVKGL